MNYISDTIRNTLRQTGKVATGVLYSPDRAIRNSGHPLENSFKTFGKFNGKYILYNTYSIFSPDICVINYIVPGNNFSSIQQSPNTIYKKEDQYVIAIKIPENIKKNVETTFPIREYDMIIVSLKKNPDGTLYKNRDGTYELHDSYTKCDDTICNGEREIEYKTIDKNDYENDGKFQKIIYSDDYDIKTKFEQITELFANPDNFLNSNTKKYSLTVEMENYVNQQINVYKYNKKKAKERQQKADMYKLEHSGGKKKTKRGKKKTKRGNKTKRRTRKNKK